MCDAGRIKHHLRHNLGRPECAIVIIGFQAWARWGGAWWTATSACASSATTRGAGQRAHHRRAVGACRPGGAAGLAARLRHAAAAHLRRARRGATACGFADRIADELGWSVEAPARLSHS
jgi:metallo-beta-lactamase family protein